MKFKKFLIILINIFVFCFVSETSWALSVSSALRDPGFPALFQRQCLVAALPKAEDILTSHGYTILKPFVEGGSSADTFLARDKSGRLVIVKFAAWDGISGNGMPWLRSQARRLREIKAKLPQVSRLFPEVYDFYDSKDFVYYSMQYFEDTTDLPAYYLKMENVESVESMESMTEDLNRLIRIFCQKIYLEEKKIKIEDYVSKAHIDRLDYRMGLLTERQGAVYDLLVKNKPIKIGGKVYQDLTYLFREILGKKEIVINGQVYPNYSVLKEILDQKAEELNLRLNPRFYPEFFHGDLLLRNILRTKKGDLRIIDIRGKSIHKVISSIITVEYEMAKIAHSLIFELVRNDLFDLSMSEQDNKLCFDFSFKNRPYPNIFIELRKRFFQVLDTHPDLKQYVHNHEDWCAQVLLSEAVHFLADAVNRMSQDSSGKHTVAYYVIGTVLLYDFLYSQDMIDKPLQYRDPVNLLEKRSELISRRGFPLEEERVLDASNFHGKLFIITEDINTANVMQSHLADFKKINMGQVIASYSVKSRIIDKIKEYCAEGSPLLIENFELLFDVLSVEDIQEIFGKNPSLKFLATITFNGYKRLEGSFKEQIRQFGFYMWREVLKPEHYRKKVAIIGGSGRLGREVEALFKKMGLNVISTGFSKQGYVHLDATNEAEVRDFFQRYSPDFVVYLSADLAIDNIEQSARQAGLEATKAYRLNAQAVETISKYFRQGNFLYVSSDAVFDGDPGHAPFLNTSPRKPVNTYGLTKRIGEDIVLGQFGDRAVIIRSGFFYGSSYSFIPDIVENLEKGTPITTNNHTVYYPVYSKDVAKFILKLFQYSVSDHISGVFHLGGDRGITKYGIVRLVAEKLGYTEREIQELVSDEVPRDSAQRPAKPYLVSSDRTTPLEIGVAEVVKESSKRKVIKIERSEKNDEFLAFVPKNGLQINLSIGGSKIAIAVVDSAGQVVKGPFIYLWREDFDKNILARNLTPLEQRVWFIDKVVFQIKSVIAAIEADQELRNIEIEGVGISWPGAINKQGLLMAPNIHGFSFDDFTELEKIAGGINLKDLLDQTIRREIQKNFNISILNDSDAAAVAAFRQEDTRNGMLVILGTGIGVGIIKDNQIFFGPEKYEERIGEIGQHIFWDPQKKKYFYYGLITKGHVLNELKGTFMDRLGGPAIARRFLEKIGPSGAEIFFPSLQTLKPLIDIFYSNGQLPFELELATLKLITEKAKQGDSLCLEFISDIGFEIGQALGAFINNFQHELFIDNIKLEGSIGYLFGKGVLNEKGSDIFLDRIKEGIRWSLRSYNMDEDIPLFLSNVKRTIVSKQGNDFMVHQAVFKINPEAVALNVSRQDILKTLQEIMVNLKGLEIVWDIKEDENIFLSFEKNGQDFKKVCMAKAERISPNKFKITITKGMLKFACAIKQIQFNSENFKDKDFLSLLILESISNIQEEYLSLKLISIIKVYQEMLLGGEEIRRTLNIREIKEKYKRKVEKDLRLDYLESTVFVDIDDKLDEVIATISASLNCA